MDDDKQAVESADKAGEYFQLRRALKDMRAELRALREEHPDTEELKQLTEKAKRLRLKIREDEQISKLQRDIETANERSKLLKEIIKAELIETEQDEVVRDGRKLKLVREIKEMKDEPDLS